MINNDIIDDEGAPGPLTNNHGTPNRPTSKQPTS